MKMTVNQLADILGVEYAIASSFIKLLELRGLATAVGKQKPFSASGRGKPSTIFEIPRSVEISIHNADDVVSDVEVKITNAVSEADFQPVVVTEQIPMTDETLVYQDA